jgi:hypothetical protein
MPLTGDSVREGAPTFVRVAVALPLELIFLFDTTFLFRQGYRGYHEASEGRTQHSTKKKKER